MAGARSQSGMLMEFLPNLPVVFLSLHQPEDQQAGIYPSPSLAEVPTKVLIPSIRAGLGKHQRWVF